MFQKPFLQIDKDDILQLRADQVPESRVLDYKQELPGGGESDKKKFSKTVSSFANAAGGYIIFGITDKEDGQGKSTGNSGDIRGLGSENADQTILRLQQVLRDWVLPRIQPFPDLRVHS